MEHWVFRHEITYKDKPNVWLQLLNPVLIFGGVRMANEEVVLLSFWACTFAGKVRVALAEKGIEYKSMEQDMVTKGDLLLKMNPVHKKIPVLIHNGKPICESQIILQYIDEIWPHKSPLLPLDPHQRAVARFWADFIDTKICELGKKIWKTKGEEKEATKKEFMESLKLLEGELGDKPYFGGENLGYVDVSLLPFSCWFYAQEKVGDFSIETDCPKLIAWHTRCMEKDSVSRSLPDQQKIYRFVLDLRKLFGVEE
ncbi:hypothetical protein V6N11_052381 [Hibiscus sabdariffa]|uniref:glutathione transferase n=1 Tax=Hibiscus sabdariffa TaxID=183260 RepID=A0ABR2UA68_9ROSI